MNQDTFQPHPELYAKLSEPFNTGEEAEKALRQFADGVRRLRKKHKISEVILLSQVYFQGEDGILCAQTGSQTCGDMMEAIRLVHRAAFNFSITTIGQLVKDIAELKTNQEKVESSPEQVK